MSEIRDKVVKDLHTILDDWVDSKYGQNNALNRILSIPELAIVDREAELPKIPFCCNDCRTTELYAMNKMQDEGWVKEVSDAERD